MLEIFPKKEDILSVQENPISHLLKIFVQSTSKNFSLCFLLQGGKENKEKGQYAYGQPKINCFSNATIPQSDLPKVLLCLH